MNACTAKARHYSVNGFSVNLEMHVITYLILGLIAGHLTLDNSLESCNQQFRVQETKNRFNPANSQQSF